MLKIYHYLTGSFVIVTVMILTLMFAAACGHQQQNKQKQTMVDSLFDAAYDVHDYEHVLTLCDSLEQRGDISLIKAGLERGWAYSSLNKNKLRMKVLKDVLNETPKNARDSADYFECVAQLVDALSCTGNYEEALQTAIPFIEDLKKLDQEKPSDELNWRLMVLLADVASVQVNLGMKEESKKSFEESYAYVKRPTSRKRVQLIYMVQLALAAVEEYNDRSDCVAAEKWLARSDSLVGLLVEGKDMLVTDTDFVDKMVARNFLGHAFLGVNQGRPEEVSRVLESYKATKYSKALEGHLHLGTLLLYQKRYAEASDEYVKYNQLKEDDEIRYSDLVLWSKMFEANYKAVRRDSALAVAWAVFEHLDSIIRKQEDGNAAELAAVYETQQKDAEIAQQQIRLTQQRLWGMLVALVLLTVFFIVYTLYRRRAQKRIADMQAAKERIESELRIAREIQMSMVPQEFPLYEGLDMYAVMNAAKEVGGDLYGYVLQGNMLHFCLGDVSGKGVPASLFMSQSARLFRTLAAEGLSPADIAFRMNKGLAENNKRMMFVTMFIGQFHLDTGRLDFCNCGHNPPVLDGQFLEMKYENHPLGLWEGDPFDGETIDDIRGRQLLIYTDGLNEAENGQKEQFGDDHLLELMADMQNLSSREVIDRLKEAVEQHRAGVEPNDDLTLMCVRLD